jgi:hypothetical protein
MGFRLGPGDTRELLTNQNYIIEEIKSKLNSVNGYSHGYSHSVYYLPSCPHVNDERNIN